MVEMKIEKMMTRLRTKWSQTWLPFFSSGTPES
jgi:hypothetical protein